GGEPHVTGEGELETAPEAGALDGGYDRERESVDAPEQALDARGVPDGDRRLVDRCYLLDVGAGDEDTLLPAPHQEGLDARRRPERVERLLELVDDRDREHVHLAGGVVED